MEANINMMQNNEADRNKTIIRTSIIGIGANLLLSAFKAVIGLMSNSIAIVLDAVNNVSDAASSLITIIGAKLATKEPDKKHPFGYGRIEYLSAMIISVIVLYAGITSFEESVKKIISPQKPDYTAVSLIIVAVGVAVKIVLGRFVKSTGQKVNSDSLINSGQDALLDSIISASTLAAAFIFLFTGYSLEAYLGAVISVLIIKSGIEMIKETISHILGEGSDPELSAGIRETVNSFEEVRGVYDIVINDYGPDTYTASLHIEVSDALGACAIDELTRRITAKVYEEHRVYLTAVGIYSFNSRDEEITKIRSEVVSCVLSHEHAMSVHGFYMDKTDNSIRMDVVISFDAESRIRVYNDILSDLNKKYPQYKIYLAMDTDYTAAE